MNKTPQRVRHEIRIRVLTVSAITDITPLMRRITLSSPDLQGFNSPGYDDHVKVFFPEPGEVLGAPTVGPEGVVWPDGKRPQMRDYTPRYFDAEAKTLQLDFVLHGDGPASGWAARAKVGDTLTIGGPRGSMIVPVAYDWYLLAGDETALPAIGRRIEELPQGAKVIAMIEVAGPDEEQAFETKADLDLTYVHRNGTPAGQGEALRKAIAIKALPSGDAFAFIAGEAAQSRAIKADLIERGLNAEWMKAAGYWLLGTADAHEPH